MDTRTNAFSTCTDAVRGMCEKHSKMYTTYIARVSEHITKYGAVSLDKTGGFADSHIEATRRKR
jgi:hypothetical protein